MVTVFLVYSDIFVFFNVIYIISLNLLLILEYFGRSKACLKLNVISSVILSVLLNA